MKILLQLFVLLCSSCLMDEKASENNATPQANEPDPSSGFASKADSLEFTKLQSTIDTISLSEPNRFLASRTMEPFMWGNSYGLDSLDSIVGGSKVIEVDIEHCSSDDELYSNVILRYRPVYTSAEEYRERLKSVAQRDIANPGKLYRYGKYQFINEINEGVHVVDNSDPNNPVYQTFIAIPGNIDIAIKNKTLLANSYSNLVAVDISNLQSVAVADILPEAFPNVNKSGYPLIDSLGGIVDYWVEDTLVTYNCWGVMEYYAGGTTGGDFIMVTMASDVSSEPNTFGQGGSLARFEISDNYLYTVDHHRLILFDIGNEMEPSKWNTQEIGRGIETIFRDDERLFVGSQTGMILFDLSKGMGNPILASRYDHVQSCDPVVVEGNLAYVTLRSGSNCWRGENRLDIVDVTDLYNPFEVSVYGMNNPHGLAIDGKYLYVCDGDAGVKSFDVSNPKRIQPLDQEDSFFAQDIILNGKYASVMTPEGMVQLDISNPSDLKIVSQTVR